MNKRSRDQELEDTQEAEERRRRVRRLTYRRTERGSSKYGKVFVGNSRIKGAGLGLFASKVIKNGSVICPYEGEVLSDKKYDKRYENSFPEYSTPHPRYTNRTIDARDCPWAFGRYANGSDHPMTPHLTANAVLTPNAAGNGVDLMATRAIKACEEILFDYGSGFWERLEYEEAEERQQRAIEEVPADESLGEEDTSSDEDYRSDDKEWPELQTIR